MSEDDLPIRFAESAQEAMDAAKSAGQLLREAREAQGLHVAALAVALKVPVKKLEALEANRLEELPDAVFVRALASSVCRALKIDAAPVLEKLPQLNTRVLTQAERGINVAFRDRGDGPAPSPLAHLNRPVVLGVFALLLAAIILILLPDFSAKSTASASVAPSAMQSNGAGVSMGNPTNVPSSPAEVTQQGATLAVSAADAASATMVATTAQAGETATLPQLTATPVLSTPSVGSPTLTISALPQGTQAVAVPADSVVVFAVTSESWIEVRDAGGQIILQRTLQSGEKAGAGPALGKLPFAVIVGRANVTQASVRGKPFDLLPVSSKEGVARFQVK
jgi:cytoskeleton protein RodZ